MTHSVTDDLYVPPTQIDEGLAEEEQRWRALTKEVEGLPEAERHPKALQGFLTLDPTWRRFLSLNDPLACAVVETAAKEATYGLLLARIDDDPKSSEAYAIALTWLHKLKIDESMLLNIAKVCIVYGDVVVWVDTQRQLMGFGPPGWRGATLEVDAQGALRLVVHAPFSTKEVFGEEEGQHVYVVPFKGSPAMLQTSLVSLLDSMLKDTLATSGLERVRPRIGIEQPIEDPEYPSSWARRFRSSYCFPAVNDLEELREAPHTLHRIVSPHDGLSDR
jgi:hypothetical protein